MVRPMWKGSVNFGLVTVPVELYRATEDHTVHFRQYERGTGDRIRIRRVNERTGVEVAYENIVKGYDLGQGESVPVEQEELDGIAPGRSRSIEIDAFVDFSEIDPIYFQNSYWVLPSSQEFARAYELLLRAMETTGRAGIATFAMRGKDHLAAIRAGEHVLKLETLHFADSIRDPDMELQRQSDPQPLKQRELDLATSLIESMAEEWRPDKHRDAYTARLKELIATKRQGHEVMSAPEPAEPTAPADLAEALSRSLHDQGGVPEPRSGAEGDSGLSHSAASGRAQREEDRNQT